eukprot:768370-Hanusia_phi.AAC.1
MALPRGTAGFPTSSEGFPGFPDSGSWEAVLRPVIGHRLDSSDHCHGRRPRRRIPGPRETAVPGLELRSGWQEIASIRSDVVQHGGLPTCKLNQPVGALSQGADRTVWHARASCRAAGHGPSAVTVVAA